MKIKKQIYKIKFGEKTELIDVFILDIKKREKVAIKIKKSFPRNSLTANY